MKKVVEVDIEQVLFTQMFAGIGVDVSFIRIVFKRSDKSVSSLCFMLLVKPLKAIGQPVECITQQADRGFNKSFFGTSGFRNGKDPVTGIGV